MRALDLVTLGALLAAASTTAAAQRPEPREPRAPRPPSVARTAPEVYAFGFGDARADRAALGVVLGEPGPDGIRVAEVADDGPAARAGIRAGDRIVAVGDVSLRLEERDADDPLLRLTAERRLRRALERLDAGDEVVLRIARGGDERTLRVRTVRADALDVAPSRPTPVAPAMPPSPRAGTMFRTLPSVRADRASVGLTLGTTGSARDTLGVFVAGVAEDGPAERAGIHEGMRIAAVNGVDLRVDEDDVDDRRLASERAARLERELSRLEPGDEVSLRVWDGGRFRDVRVRSARASEVYRDGARAGLAPEGMMRLRPGTTIYGMPGADALRRLEALEGARGELRRREAPEVRVERLAPRTEVRVLPRGAAPRVLRVAPDVRVEIEEMPDVQIEIHDLDDLSPDERARVERRIEEARAQLERVRVRTGEARVRMIESRAGEQARATALRATRAAAAQARGAAVRARVAEVEARAGAAAALRATRAVAPSRRWMD